MNFLWGVAKSGAEAMAGRERLSPGQLETEEPPPKRTVVVFVLGGIAPAELQAFGAFEGFDNEVGGQIDHEFLVGSTCVTSPTRLAANIFGDLMEGEQPN